MLKGNGMNEQLSELSIEDVLAENARLLEEVARLRAEACWVPTAERLPEDAADMVELIVRACYVHMPPKYGHSGWVVDSEVISDAIAIAWRELPTPPEVPE